jgi:hypothetical protein
MRYTHSTLIQNSRKAGIALITVLIVAGLLALLMVSFTRVHQQNFGLIKNNLHEQAAQEGARSILDYCLYRLEQDRSWGAAVFTGSVDASVSDSLEVTEVEDSFKIEGRVKETDTLFEVEVLNNIDGDARVDGLEKGFCRLRISTKRGTAEIRREAVLKTAPLFDGGVVASKDIVVKADSLVVSSTDPFRNRLRARKQIRVPSYKNSFRFRPADNATEKGVLWAKGGILSGSTDLRDPKMATEASEMTGGKFVPQADTHYDIYDLQLNEIKASEETTKLNSGIYVFNRRKVEFLSGQGYQTKEIAVLERRDSALDTNGQVKQGDLREVWFLKSSLPDSALGRTVELFGNDVPQEGIHAKDRNKFQLEKGVEAKFNSVDPDFNGNERPPEILINTNRNLVVDGDFGVTSWNHKYFPTVKFQERNTGEVGTDDQGRLVSGSITTKAHKGRPGSIFIAGRIVGNGKLLAEGDVTIRNTFADVSSDTLSDLSIFAGGSVTLRPQKARNLDGNTVFDGGGDGTTRFRGLIFARDDVLIEADLSKRNSKGEKGDVFIEGAVVSRGGNVHVFKAANIEFKYNPEFLDSILKPKRGSRVRLEQVVWKEV